MRKVTILSIFVVLLTAAFASAAGLNVSGGAIQAGEDITYCSDGVAVTGWGLELDDNTVRSVTIGGIDANCAGNTMFVRVYDANGVELETAQAELTGAVGQGFSFNPAPWPSPESIESIKIWIEGAAQ